MVDPKKARNDQQEKNKMVVKLSKAASAAGSGGGIGAVVLLGGALVTTALAAAFVMRRKGRKSGENNQQRHHLSPPSTVDFETLNNNTSDGAINMVEEENSQSVMLEEKPKLEINCGKGSAENMNSGHVPAEKVKLTVEYNVDLETTEEDEQDKPVNTEAKQGEGVRIEDEEISTMKGEEAVETIVADQITVEMQWSEESSDGCCDQESEAFRIDAIKGEFNKVDHSSDEIQLEISCDKNEENVCANNARDYNEDVQTSEVAIDDDSEEELLFPAANKEVKYENESSDTIPASTLIVEDSLVTKFNEDEEKSEVIEYEVHDVHEEDFADTVAETTKLQGLKLDYHETEGKIQEDCSEITDGKRNSRETSIDKYIVGLATQFKNPSSPTRKQILIGTLSVAWWMSCSWFFGLSYASLCLIVFFTMVLLKIHGY